MATVMAATCPLYWLTAARPLSDAVGLTAAIAIQAATLGSMSLRRLAAAAFAAGLVTGIRSQAFWLTVPLLFVTGPTRDNWPAQLSRVRPVTNRLALAVASFAAGVLVWFIPLVALTGGPSAYWRAVVNQGAEDLTGIQMLWTEPTARELLDALYYAFVAPWAVGPLAAVVLTLASAGALVLIRRDRRALVLMAAAFGPYLVFDILFQETFTVRYALPVVVPVAGLAAAGLRALPAPAALAAAAAVAMTGAHLGGRSVAAYSRTPAPVFRMLADMRAPAAAANPVLAPDRRHSFDLRRPLRWLGGEAPRFERQLAAPPQHEWLEAVKYWTGGGRQPVWFVVDPRRAAIGLIDHGDPLRYRWELPYPVLMSGTRPGDADVYNVDAPDWFVGNGWALTPEAGGIAAHDKANAGPLSAWISSRTMPGHLMIGGRNLGDRDHEVTIAFADGVVLADFRVPPGFFVRFAPIPDARGTGAFRELRVTTSGSDRVALEQFDASAGSPMLAFGPGFYEHEYNPATGLHWRWLSDRGELLYLAPRGGILEIDGESPRKYYPSDSRLTVRAGGTTLRDVRLGADFKLRLDVPPAPAPSPLVLETDQTYVPAETSWRGSRDRRRLGLRIFRCQLRPRP